MDKKIAEIKTYPNNIEIHWIDGSKNESLNTEEFADDESAHGIDTINYDGQQGEYTREEWMDDEIVSQYKPEDREEILRTLEMTSNASFFKENAKTSEYKITGKSYTGNVLESWQTVDQEGKFHGWAKFNGETGEYTEECTSNDDCECPGHAIEKSFHESFEGWEETETEKILKQYLQRNNIDFSEDDSDSTGYETDKTSAYGVEYEKQIANFSYFAKLTEEQAVEIEEMGYDVQNWED